MEFIFVHSAGIPVRSIHTPLSISYQGTTQLLIILHRRVPPPCAPVAFRTPKLCTRVLRRECVIKSLQKMAANQQNVCGHIAVHTLSIGTASRRAKQVAASRKFNSEGELNIFRGRNSTHIRPRCSVTSLVVPCRSFLPCRCRKRIPVLKVRDRPYRKGNRVSDLWQMRALTK